MPWFGALIKIDIIFNRLKAMQSISTVQLLYYENKGEFLPSVACHGKYSLKFSVTSFFLYNFRSYNELARNDTWQEFDTCRFRS